MKKTNLEEQMDGMSLMNDVGGIHGYIDFLRTVHGNDLDEREDMKSWGTGRMA